jgi:hypothetical protein
MGNIHFYFVEGLQFKTKMFVPVVDSNQRPLMPTTSSRARRWIKQKKATPYWKKGVFCVRLNVEPIDRKTQPIAVGIDPGSKREGYTVKSKSHIYLNIQTHAVDWVKEHVKTRRNMRRARRFRNTPCRQNRENRLVNKQKLPPSTKARWQWKLRICKWLASIFPVTVFVVEDIKAKTLKGGAEALFNLTREYLQKLDYTNDPYQQERVARMAMAVESGNLWLKGAADVINNLCSNFWRLSNTTTSESGSVGRLRQHGTKYN